MKKIFSLPVLLLLAALTGTAKDKEPRSQAGVSFKENKGQLKDQHEQPRNDIRFYGSTQGLSYYLKSTGVSYQLYKQHGSAEKRAFDILPQQEERKADSVTIYRIDISWPGANTNAQIITTGQEAGVEHYYTSATPVTDVKSYGSITYKNIYPSIDLKYYSKEGSLKYDYIVKPGADYKDIKLKIEGASSITKNKDGSIIIHTPLGDIGEGQPKVYQEGKAIPANWLLKDNTLSFKITDFNPAKSLIIDPMISTWSAQIGPLLPIPQGNDCTMDNNGNLFWCGWNFNAFLNKYDNNNNLLFANTYPPPINMFGAEFRACSVDNQGDVYSVGSISNTSTLATVGAYQTIFAGASDAIIVKVNNSGVTQWATYYGGSGSDVINGCAVDINNNLYTSGTTSSVAAISSTTSNQPTYGGGSSDGFIVKLSPTGSRVWATYYGGLGKDAAAGCTIDKSQWLYVCGRTSSSSSIATPGSFQNSFSGTNTNGYIVKLDTNGVRYWGSYYGSDSTVISKCTTDTAGNLYFCGTTSAAVNIATSGTYQTAFGGSLDAFLVKFDNSGSRIWGTYSGGAGWDGAVACAVNTKGRVYLAGNIALSPNVGGYIEEFDTTGQRFWAHYFGTLTQYNFPIQVNNCYADSSGNAFVSGSYRTTTTGSGYGFITKFVPYTVPTPVLTVFPSTQLCQGDTVTLSTTAITGAAYTWYLNGLVITAATSATYKATLAGTYKVKIVNNYSTDSSQAVVLVQMPKPSTTVTKTNLLCNGNSSGAITILATGGTPPYSFAYTNTAATTSTITGLPAGIYISTVTDNNGCYRKDTTTITQPPALSSTKAKTNVSCFGGNNGSATVTVSGGTAPYTYSWSNSPTTSSISNLAAGSYILTTTDNHNCTRTDTVAISQPTAITNTQSHTDVSCKGGNNGTASITPAGGMGPYTYTWSTAAITAGITSLVAGMYTVVIKDNNNCAKNDTVYVVEPASFLSSSLTAIHNTCYNDSTGKAFVTASGATPSYTYAWSNGSSIISTADSAIQLKAGSYYLTTMDANLCQKKDTIAISEPLQAIDSLCAVSVDSATGKNLVVWEKLGVQNAMLYKIYRETVVANQYSLIGTNASNQFSTFLDTSSIPQQQSYRYKLSVVDSCNNESPLSAYHKTIHLSSNTGIGGQINLTWNLYEGKPYTTHYIMRSVNSGSFINIAQVGSNITSYTDLFPPAGQNTYRIDINLLSLCNPTAKTTEFSRISSNRVSEGTNGISNTTKAEVYIVPNPTTGLIRIIGEAPAQIKITDALGKLVLEEQNKSELSLEKLASGIYMIKLYNKEGRIYHYQKIVKD